MFEVSYLLGKVLKQILPAGNQDSVTLTCFFHVLLLCVAVWNSNHYLSYKICFFTSNGLYSDLVSISKHWWNVGNKHGQSDQSNAMCVWRLYGVEDASWIEGISSGHKIHAPVSRGIQNCRVRSQYTLWLYLLARVFCVPVSAILVLRDMRVGGPK
jgi:hypothetical protein